MEKETSRELTMTRFVIINSVGDNFAYGRPWGNYDLKCFGLTLVKGDPAYCAQGNHDDFSHTATLAHAFDFAIPRGAPVVAAREGVVVDVASHFRKGGLDPKFKLRANYVIIRHEDGTYGRYFHVKHESVLVKKGQVVKQGTLLARCGGTGYVGGPHLHFDVTDLYIKETSVLRVTQGVEFFAPLKKQLQNTTTIREVQGGNDNKKVLLIESGFANFSEHVSHNEVISSTCVLANPSTIPEHENLLNAEDIAGNIACCHRGGNSTFLSKAKVLQAAGAAAVVIIDSDETMHGVLPLIGSDDPEHTPCQIPVVIISSEAGKVLEAALANAGHALNLELTRSPFLRASSERATQADVVEPGMSFVKPLSQPVLFVPNKMPWRTNTTTSTIERVNQDHLP